MVQPQRKSRKEMLLLINICSGETMSFAQPAKRGISASKSSIYRLLDPQTPNNIALSVPDRLFTNAIPRDIVENVNTIEELLASHQYQFHIKAEAPDGRELIARPKGGLPNPCLAQGQLT